MAAKTTQPHISIRPRSSSYLVPQWSAAYFERHVGCLARDPCVYAAWRELVAKDLHKLGAMRKCEQLDPPLLAYEALIAHQIMLHDFIVLAVCHLKGGDVSHDFVKVLKRSVGDLLASIEQADATYMRTCIENKDKVVPRDNEDDHDTTQFFMEV
jgi:hypothetical protein